MVFAARATERLVRDAAALGLGRLDPGAVAAAMLEAGRADFGPNGEGVVRLEARRGPVLVPATRPLGPEPERWRAIVAGAVHPGPGPILGAKRTGVAELAKAREEARVAGVDETLLFDAAHRLVEGARTNLLVARADGRLCMPPLTRGAVRGVAQDIVLAAGVPIEEQDLSRQDCAAAREIVATNSVRGAHPIIAVDGVPVGGGEPGPLYAALAAALEQAAQAAAPDGILAAAPERG
jgi:branched-subunit amino acid aminotransferase/4-amino-4-deoxychorismate lyase